MRVENNSKIELINLSSIKMEFLSCSFYNVQLKLGRMIANLVVHMTQFMVWQKDQYFSRYDFLKFVVLMIDLILRVIVHSKICNIMLVATKVYLILRSFVVLTWIHDKDN